MFLTIGIAVGRATGLAGKAKENGVGKGQAGDVGVMDDEQMMNE